MRFVYPCDMRGLTLVLLGGLLAPACSGGAVRASGQTGNTSPASGAAGAPNSGSGTESDSGKDGSTTAGTSTTGRSAGASGMNAAKAGTGGLGHADAGASNGAGAAGQSAAGQSAAAQGAAAQSAAGQSAAAQGAAGTPGLPGWTLLWSDEFEGPAGTPVDGSKWNLVNKGDGFGNNELEFYTNRTDNAALDGAGSLVITAKKESYMGHDYTSARLESSGKFEHAYGRVEARIQIPRGQGIWPAFWMLGNDIGSMSWPACGEIDIMENIGKEPSIVHGSMHGPGYSGSNPLSAAYTLPNGARFADAFHVFAIEWEAGAIRFYVDSTLYETRTPADLPSNTKWVYDHPFYLLLNVAVGGGWPGSPDSTSVFPQTMLVDYVRVYTR